MSLFSKIIAWCCGIVLMTGVVYAQSSSGSLVNCGESTPCTFDDLTGIVKGAITTVIAIGMPLLVVFIVYRFVVAWYQVANGNSSAYRDAIKKAGNAVFGFFITILLIGGFLITLLSVFGASEFTTKLIKLFSQAIIPHAYAETLPNPTNIDNLFDFILAALRVIMRFFIYPALIVMWAWTGFSFVYAQGKPEALTKAKKLLMWATVSTFIVFITQGAIMAIKGTAQQVLPGAFPSETRNQTSDTTTTRGGNDGRGVPVDGETNSQCVMSDGTYGIRDINNNCVSNSRTYSSSPCDGKPEGTQCAVQTNGVVGGYSIGVCKSNEEGVFGCYRAQPSDVCLVQDATGNTISGYMNNQLQCAPSR
jgi:hypothetical protein